MFSDGANNRIERYISMRVKIIRGSMLLLLFCVTSAYAGGLRTQLGEVVVENLQIGQTYNLADLANLSLRVTNTSDYRTELRMDFLIPDEVELKHQARPIPNLSWITLTCDSFSLDAGQEAVSDIMISIPDDEQYLGKRFQFMIWSHTVPSSEGGMFLATGLKSRIVFTTDTVRADLPLDSAKPSGNAAFSVSPSEIHLNAVPLGSRYDVRKANGTALVVKNPTAEELTLRLYSKTVSSTLASVEPGWEDTPDAGYLTFEADEIRIPPQSERTVNLYLHIPSEAGLDEKQLMFLIHVCDETRQVTTGVYVRVFASLKQ